MNNIRALLFKIRVYLIKKFLFYCFSILLLRFNAETKVTELIQSKQIEIDQLNQALKLAQSELIAKKYLFNSIFR